MKPRILIGIVPFVALALAGCGTAGLGAGNSDVIGTLKEIASDPRCAHTDRVSGNLGGLGGNNLNVFLERQCPLPQAAIDNIITGAPPPK